VTTVRRDVPQHVADAITACLAADPAQRPQTADEVIGAFGGERVTTGGNTTRAATLGVRRQNRSAVWQRVWISAAAVALLSAGAYVLAASRSAPTTVSGAAAAADSEMVVIPAGDYAIGSDNGPAAARPSHTEHVAAFRIGRTEVTVDAYERFVIATQAPTPWSADVAKPNGRLPVTHVPWGDAANYCAWKYPAGGRLPTEVEWEAAARGRAGRAYPYGDASQAASANTESAHRSGPTPVGSFPRGATPEGLHDMSGNVWEWTSSPMQAYPGGRALADSLAQYRVIRGGAFDTGDSLATAWWRGYLRATSPASALPNTGFRCVASPTSSPAHH
jgi:formylglycine-generating enzyme required for sulfatase activity